MFGMIPEYMMSMPTEVANMYVTTYKEIETWKTTMSKKDLLFAIYTDALTTNDKMRIMQY